LIEKNRTLREALIDPGRERGGGKIVTATMGGAVTPSIKGESFLMIFYLSNRKNAEKSKGYHPGRETKLG